MRAIPMTPDAFWSEINVSEMAAQLGLSRNAVYKWKRSEKGIPAERAAEISSLRDIKKSAIRPDLWAEIDD
jgi:DNA-binding transcriptional regulator YdaS (Cro superfamily)